MTNCNGKYKNADLALLIALKRGTRRKRMHMKGEIDDMSVTDLVWVAVYLYGCGLHEHVVVQACCQQKNLRKTGCRSLLCHLPPLAKNC